ncbi:uncharacterized protein TRIVIDRAFT_34021 [Trichoderma virens Gv29-8]|uniref:Microbial-type PARG catalytic domain-containing protein n=1 Tax=Hypocrea virens (strain Gv29-8 / FGSC 10586) TaxID=413071 RepID=G9MEW2_HYPVG|nr:uncharacterized protein TRIVIDRAFT_34021 [Trichoderma virens Gv29-8]EHK26930.1 hypothetical protein TRIVIDRAFT_34021 [Trichoderma virens Gv29-8]UKZ57382.1 hypothetical protein TrVGV298_011236 [Trichoderma virens]
METFILNEVTEESRNVLNQLWDKLSDDSFRLRRSDCYDDEELWSFPRNSHGPAQTSSVKISIRVYNEHMVDAAIKLQKRYGGRVVVLSNADFRALDGDWGRMTIAQEEDICRRTSLLMSMVYKSPSSKIWALNSCEGAGIYVPEVVVFRKYRGSDKLFESDTEPEDLPTVSVIRISALKDFKVDKEKLIITDGVSKVTVEKQLYGNTEDRERMKTKMRLSLRIAAVKGHRLLVLGAFGCGTFGNPSDDVAECWLEVLREDEFRGGWWKAIWFAVFDPNGDGDFEIFRDVLHGAQV